MENMYRANVWVPSNILLLVVAITNLIGNASGKDDKPENAGYAIGQSIPVQCLNRTM